MKKVIKGEELQTKLIEAIDLLCTPVKRTLGPKGSNIIISHSLFSPFITNDGVTIAENIESDDIVINTILEIAKEASLKTNENVGDGTTTTLVLLQSLFNNGLELIKQGINPIVLKKELDNMIGKLNDLIKEKSRKIKDEEIFSLVSNVANSKKIGYFISEAYSLVKSVDGIKIIESNNFDTKIEYLKGYNFETNIASSYYFINKKELELLEPKILLIDNICESIDNFSEIINKLMEENKDLVIIAKDYSQYFINSILSLNSEININIYLLKSIEYGNKEKYFYDDLKVITNGNIVSSENSITLNDLGVAKFVNINEDVTKIEFEINNEIEKRIKTLEENPNEDNKKRLVMLKNGFVNILVGAPTNTERRELKMRYDDALCALKTISGGVLPGGGIVLLEIANKLTIKNTVTDILKKTLKSPFQEIMNNAGIDYKVVEDKILNSDYTLLYNVDTNKYEDVLVTKILDSTSIIVNTLTNAVSIAGMLLTTTCLIINEVPNNLNKINNYNEL